MSISILNPVEHSQWDDLLCTADRAAFFHSSAWARVLSESYGYIPRYFTIIDNGKLAGMIPVMEIKSFLTGRRGVSLPFTDYCPPVNENIEVFRDLINAVIEYGRKARWRGIEFRGGGEYLRDEPVCARHSTHILALDRDEQKVFAAFKSSTRRNIRRAGSEGVEVQLLNSREAMADFFRLNCITRRHHGLPPQPLQFFEKIFEHIIAAQKGFVALATFQSKPIAGAVYFHFRDEGIYKFGASDKDYQHLRANNLVMWEAIRWCCRNGVSQFHFGRTEPKNEGLLQFKRGWGAVEGGLLYHKYDLRSNRYVAGGSGSKTSYAAFKALPLPMLRFAGHLLYRHVG